MSIIDGILAKLGLQRKGKSVPSQTQIEQKWEAAQKEAAENERMLRGMRGAIQNMFAALTDQKAADINAFAEKVRSGSLSKQEIEMQIEKIFGKPGGVALSPEIEQALLDALKKRGREDGEQETPG
jgi:ATP-dependent protease HslVU (ClpYQ) ATPase subunit